MKNTLVIIALLMLVSIQAQTHCHIKDYWEQMFVLDTNVYKQKVHYFIDVKPLPEKHTCARQINKHMTDLKYIRSNYTNYKNKKKDVESITDSVMRQQKLTNLLKNDTMFIQAIIKLGNAWQQNSPKDTVSMNTLMDIAAHYFYLIKITADGRLLGRVCTGANGLNDLKTDRKPIIELFVFYTVFNNYSGKTGQKKYNLRNEYLKGIKDIINLDFGETNNEKKLNLIQGALYYYMYKNQNLKSLLIDAYEKQKDSLPFVLKKES